MEIDKVKRRNVMNWKRLVLGITLSLVIIMGSSHAAFAGDIPDCEPAATRIASGLGEFLVGSTVGPDGALYVPEGAAGRIWRVDQKTGEATTFASGLPKTVVLGDLGGAVDVAFIDDTAYILVTLVGKDYGGNDVVGIYRMDGPDSYTVIADIGTWSMDHPPIPEFVVPSGVQFSMQPYKGGFLVTDGHHNRVLFVRLNGKITELVAFSDVVPTGLAVWGNRIYMTEAGPIPHHPQDGKIITFKPKSYTPKEVASGASMLIDVEFGPGRTLYALSHGIWPDPSYEGAPAVPNTGSLVKVDENGSLTAVIGCLNQPTSLEFIGKTAYALTLGGEIWKIDNVSSLP